MQLNKGFAFKTFKRILFKPLLLMVCLSLCSCANKPMGEFKDHDQEEAQALQFRLSLEPLYGINWTSNLLSIAVKAQVALKQSILILVLQVKRLALFVSKRITVVPCPQCKP